MTPLSRARGCLLGLAVGDALGTTLEFHPPGTFTPITDMVGGGPFDLKPGEWTDDTSMALCLAESLLAKNGFDPVHQLQTYCRWYRHGHFSVTGRCFDIGNVTRTALHAFETTGDPYPGPTAVACGGNGSLMRLAPVPIFWAGSPFDAVRLAGQSSRTTHGSPECVDACRYYAGLTVAALRGLDKAAVLNNTFEPVQAFLRQPPTPKIWEVAAGFYKTMDPPAIKGSGYVVKSLEAALWAFHRTDTFRDGALLAVNLGDDADTTGAVYGQLAGAYYGEDGIPAEWRAKLAMRGEIESLADRLFAASGLE